jgi:hypothetical protein
MPLQLSWWVAQWLQRMAIIEGKVRKGEEHELTFNEQIEFENGYLVARLLKALLRESGSTAEGLLRVRKIAYISSN